MNDEVHGNTTPHLHMHFFPRYPGDPFEGTPINPRIGPVPGLGGHAKIRRQVRQRLRPSA